MTAMDDETPRFGYGRGQRPLWTVRDRNAENMRQALRKAGFRDFDERHLDGFAVEGANSSLDGDEPYLVTYCADAPQPGVLQRYAATLTGAGFTVAADPDDVEHCLEVRP